MTFSTYHPAVNFLFFAAVLLFGMLLMHPIFLVIALIFSLAYSILLHGASALRFNVLTMLPLVLFMALLNPFFNHEGATLLFTAFGDYPITLESVLYGAAAAAMFVTVLSWFSCYNVILTSDKLQFLFSRFTPSLSLMFSMTLRLIPRMKAQLKAISDAQRCIGRDVSDGGLLRRARHGMRMLSVMATWALENAIDTADSMRSRGFGLPGRTFFSIFRYTGRDRVLTSLILVFSAVIAGAMGTGAIRYDYFPNLSAAPVTPAWIAAAASYALLCMAPLFIELLEALRWKLSESRI